MRVHCLQHEPFEGMGSMEGWVRARGASLRVAHVYRGQPVPAVDDFDWLVILGGGMSVNDEEELGWLKPEKELVRAAIGSGKVVLGICLGAQIIASALGSKVYPNRCREIGWWPVDREAGAEAHPVGRVLPARGDVFHWHGETFDLPAGAIRLARSEACLNQIFAVGERVVGLQCHLETTVESARALVEGLPGDLVPGPFVQAPEELLRDPARFGELNGLMVRVLEALPA